MVSLPPISLTVPAGIQGATLFWRQRGTLRLTVLAKLTATMVPGQTAKRETSPPVDTSSGATAELSPYLPTPEIVLSGRPAISEDKPARIRAALARSGPVWEKRVDLPVGDPRLRILANPLAPSLFGALNAFVPGRKQWLALPALEARLNQPLAAQTVLDLPDAFDFRYFQWTAEDQQLKAIVGDEWLVLEGFHGCPPRLDTKLPGYTLGARWCVPGGSPVAIEGQYDRLSVEPDQLSLTMYWRGSFLVPQEAADGLLIQVLGSGTAADPIARSASPTGSAPTQMLVAAPTELPHLVANRSGNPAAAPNQHTFLMHIPSPINAGGSNKAVELQQLPMASVSSSTVAFNPDELKAALPFAKAPMPVPPAPPPPAAPGTAPLDPTELAKAIRAIMPFDPNATPSLPAAVERPAFSPPSFFHAFDSPPTYHSTAPIQIPTPPPPPPVVAAPPEPAQSPVSKAHTAVPDTAAPVSPANPQPTRRSKADTGAPLSKAVVSAAHAELFAALDKGERTFYGVDLSGADLSDRDLEGIALSGCNLTGAKLVRCNLANARLIETKLEDADLTEARLTGADLSRAALSRACLDQSDLQGANLTDATLVNSRGQAANLSGAQASRASFLRGRWDNARFDKATLRDADFGSCSLAEASFQEADLTDARLIDSRATTASFERANLASARFDGASLAGASLRSATGSRSSWERVTFTNACLENADLPYARFGRAKLDGAKVAHAILTQGMFQGATAAGASFDFADLESADLRQLQAAGASFEGATMRQIQGGRADLSGANLKNASLERASLRPAQLPGANLEGANLDNADLRDANLEGATLTRSSRNGTKLAGAKLKSIVE